MQAVPSVLETYLQFVKERHLVWERRYAGQPGPWTDDPVLQRRKFCNVFRAIDHGSQFVIKELLYGDDRTGITTADVFMRSFLYRYTNRPEPWEFFHVMHGRYPLRHDLDSGLLLDTWRAYAANGGTVFGVAYKMFVGQENRGVDRLTWAVRLAEEYFAEGTAHDTVQRLARCTSLQERLDVLRTIPRCADFMSMQVATDIGYSAHVQGDENETVLHGPGSRKGAGHIVPGAKPVDVIRWLQEEFWSVLPDAPALALPDGREHRLSLMDVQNSLCEFGKYMRYRANGPARGYRPAHPGQQPRIMLPEHW